MSTIPKEIQDKISEAIELYNNPNATKAICELFAGYQLATDGREHFWTEEMILRFAELYRWSSARITMKGFKQSKEWQTASIHAAKEIAKQIDDGREELERQLQDSLLLYNNQTNTITALQSSLKEKEEENEINKERGQELINQVLYLYDSLKEKDQEIESWKESKESWEYIANEKSKQIEELKAENERLKIGLWNAIDCISQDPFRNEIEKFRQLLNK